MTKYLDEDDLVEFFGQEVLTGLNETDKELGWYYCEIFDQYKFILNLDVIMLEDWYLIALYHITDTDLVVFDVDMQNLVRYATRDKSVIRFFKSNKQLLATLSLEPNFSLNLPELSITKEPTPQMLELPMVFCQRTIGILFECEPAVDEAGNISFSKTNDDGFALFVTVLPNVRKCFAKLMFVHYQDPVFQVTFTNIVAIDCDLNTEEKGLIIKGQQESEVVKILFNPTFSMELDTWIFYGQLL